MESQALHHHRREPVLQEPPTYAQSQSATRLLHQLHFKHVVDLCGIEQAQLKIHIAIDEKSDLNKR